MKYHVVGIRRFIYTSKRTGKPVNAANLYCRVESDRIDPNLTGERYETFYVSLDVLNRLNLPDDILIGSEIQLFYNRYGNIDDIRVA